MNDCIPFYRPGADITGQATAAVTGKRCVNISGNRQVDRSISVAHAAAGGRIFGVAGFDAAQGKKVTIIRGPGTVLPIKCAANINAFDEVEVGANGQVIPKAAGVAIGYAVTAAVNGADAEISLY